MKNKLNTKQMNINLTPNEEGMIEGYLNNYNVIDHANDISIAGCFDKSLQAINESGRPLPILWSHDIDEPIGEWIELTTDSTGLWGKGRLNLEVQRAREVHELIKSGSITGISIGYITILEKYVDGVNQLLEVDLKEASPVVMPCNEDSRIYAVKAEPEPEKSRLEIMNELLESLNEDELNTARTYIDEKLSEDESEQEKSIVNLLSKSVITTK